MKKSIALAFGFAMLAGTAFAQNAQEVTYVEDPAQGYLFNKFSDNWFIQGEGGVTMGFTQEDSHRDIMDRLAPAAHLYVGKWFSPLLGFRVGADFLSVKGLSNDEGCVGLQPWEPMTDGRWKTKINYVGPSFSVMLNLTNWWCGYRPGRVYNAYIYGGGAFYWSYTKQPDGTDYKWKDAHDRVIGIHAGIMNEFNITKNFALGLDIRANAISNHSDQFGKTQVVGEALLSATYKFNKADWSAPIVPVCPPAENCDEYRARLQAADARIADLEAQLKACLSRPVEKVVAPAAKQPLATIYYPCDVYRLTAVDRQVLKSVANVMNADKNRKYVLTGWADNYTGNDQINVRLRHNRVNGVKNQLLKYGVSNDQIEATTNNANRLDLGDKCLTLDRCVTIVEK